MIRLIHFPQVIISAYIKQGRADEFTRGHFKSEIRGMCYPAAWGAEGMEPSLARLCADARCFVV